jgi:lysozyme family protein
MLGVVQDGIVGTKTLSALNAEDPRTLFDRIKKERELFFNNIVKRDPTQKRFIKG